MRRLTRYLTNMRRIFAVMITFGVIIGIAFPYAVDPFVEWDPDRKLLFRLTCIAAGLAVGSFCYLLVKITLYQRNLLLARAKKEWETSFDALTEGVVVVDADGLVARANSSFAGMFGLTTQELLGKPAVDLARQRGWGDCLLEKALNTGESQSGEGVAGGRILIQTAEPIFETDGRVIGCVGVLRDMTDDRRLRQELIQSAKMAAVGRLVAGAAHELNNPLTGVVAMSQLLLSHDLDRDMRRDLEKIVQEGKRAADIVTHLLSFIQESKTEMRELDVNLVLNDVLTVRSAGLQGSGVTLERCSSQGLPLVLADRVQLSRLFVNLIDNAEHAVAGNGGGRLLITTESSQGYVRVHFADDGPGIAPEAKEQVFDPFFTTKGIGEGAGLGLSVCFGIAQDHGGHIRLEEGTVRGAHFVVELPVAQAAAA